MSKISPDPINATEAERDALIQLFVAYRRDGLVAFDRTTPRMAALAHEWLLRAIAYVEESKGAARRGR